MKKWFRLWILAVMMLILAACGSGQERVSEKTSSEIQRGMETSGEAVEADSGETESDDPVLDEDQSDIPAGVEEILEESESDQLSESAVCTSKEDVAEYIHIYGHLPDNFITKKEASSLGWEGGSLEPYAPGKCIGGNRFGNYEGLLPEKEERFYTECDIDTLGASGRGAKRIVFSNDGLIYYTEDHYESFELLYGEE